MANNSKANGLEEDDTSSQGTPPKDRISSALKQVYDDVASEPLPDKLSSLLEQLRQGDQK